NATKNPFAQFHKKLSISDVMESKRVADPLKLLDCSPLSDGAAVAILAPLETALKMNDTPIKILASAQASDTLRLAERDSLTGIKATQIAGANALRQAKVSLKDISVAEMHDCFTIAE